MKRKPWLIAIFVLAGMCCVASFIAYKQILNGPPSQLTAQSGYHVRGSKVYYYPGFGIAEPFEIQGADAKSFEILDSSYARDRVRVYYAGVAVSDSDPATFEVFDETFARDVRHVYVNGDIFSDDPAHLEHVDRLIYRDSQHIYWSTSTVSDDPANLVVSGTSGFYTYFRDSTTVFINGNPMQDADPATFVLIRDGYARDAKNIFYFDSVILGAVSSTFEIIDSPYARDASHVYFMENVLPDADPATFIVLNVNFQCSADATHAYYQGDLIPDFDPASIPPGVIVTNCDASGIYFSQ